MTSICFLVGKMPEGITAEKLLDSIMDTFTESSQKQKSVSFFEEDKSNSVSAKMNKLLGRQKTIHNILGGGKSADVLLWRNKKISGSFLTAATAIWVLFEWLNYHFLFLVCIALIFGMLAQFVWSNASGILNRSPSKVPRFVVPEEVFLNIGATIGSEVNRFLIFIQDISCGGDLKQFVMVVLGLWAAAVIGSWFNFLTVFYVGFVAAHTLPVLYERYEDEVDNFIYNLLGQLRNQYSKLDAGVLSKIPKGNLKGKKSE
ncbi:hypothetical protein NE237_001440 [Protea cynaroides]|uniref:Reticulon-like protein n=1 Tax=Protea cynaroides TaxID=273540 RepID=A0A9Q0QYF6_9MAGN|nr:hypothetical protein NE237_001440 [Protea cynaroides]